MRDFGDYGASWSPDSQLLSVSDVGTVPAGTLVIEAAKQAGIEIPADIKPRDGRFGSGPSKVPSGRNQIIVLPAESEPRNASVRPSGEIATDRPVEQSLMLVTLGEPDPRARA